MTNPYTQTKEDIAASYRRIHGNSEQTHIAVLSAGENAYVAVAYDVDPREYEPVAAEIIAYDPTIDGVVQKADRWMETHPKGVLGESESGGGGSRVLSALKKLNDYGNNLADQPEESQ